MDSIDMAEVMAKWGTREGHRVFENWRALSQLDYFELDDDGLLHLVVDGLDGIIDFHTHLGWTVFMAPSVDVTQDTGETIHNFGPDLKVNLDIYSGMNFYEERPKWGVQDYLPCAIMPLRRGKHHTHTIPNILREMDALKIERSVCLCLDIAGSSNTRRFLEAAKNEPRLPMFCAVHPKHRRRDECMVEYLAAGSLGMKVHPELQMTPIDSEQMLSMLAAWNETARGLPVLFHSGFNGFEPKKAREHAAIELYYPAAETLTDCPCILGHSSMNQFETAIEIAKKHPNVYLELSGQPPAHIRQMLDELGPDRLLYGTDWPVYPQAIAMTKILVATEDNPEARVKLLRDNAARLLSDAQKISDELVKAYAQTEAEEIVQV